MKTYNPTHLNESDVLEKIINSSKISRSELAEITKFKKSSISDITKTLLKNSLIYEDSLGSSSNLGGRKPIFLKFNNKCSLIIGLEIGKNYLVGYLTYMNGEILKEIKYTNIDLNKDNIVSKTESVINELSEDIPDTPYGIVGAGIAVPGSVLHNEINFTPYSSIDEVDFSKQLSKRVDFPVLLINEANAAALGEYSFGTNFENLININIGDGIGAGIVEGGNLFIGKHGNAGEIGHTTLYPNGILCPCGNRGCIEQYASLPALFDKLYTSTPKSEYNISTLKNEWENNQNTVKTILNENVEYISVAINNIVTTYDPGVVIINSELYREIPDLVSQIKHKLTGKNSKDINIINTQLKGNSTIFGCISIVAQDFLKINKIKFNS